MVVGRSLYWTWGELILFLAHERSMWDRREWASRRWWDSGHRDGGGDIDSRIPWDIITNLFKLIKDQISARQHCGY